MSTFQHPITVKYSSLFALSGIVISQAVRGGFRFRTVDEIAEKRHEIEDRDPVSPSSEDRKEPSVDEKKVSVEYIDNV